MHNRLPARLLRAAACLVALAVLLAGVPALLLQVPAPWAALEGGVWQALTGPDDGSLLLAVLGGVGWALWLWFVLSLLVEAWRLVRRRGAVRVRGLGGPQRLAGVLLGGLVLLPGTAATALAATPAQAVPAAAAPSTTAAPSAAAETAAEAVQDRASGGPSYTVGATGETVWDIAEECLGDGRRHAEVRALNPDLPGTATLPPGTRVQLPADATTPSHFSPAGAATPASDVAEEEPTHRVEEGARSLQDVAQQRLEDGSRWKDVRNLNPELGQINADESLQMGTELRMPSDTPPQTTGGAGDQDAGGEGQRYVVQEGETLWGIAEDEYGDGTRYTDIVEANPKKLADPDLIHPQQRLTLPGDEGSAGDTGDGQAPDRSPGPDSDTGSAEPAPDEEKPEASGGEHKSSSEGTEEPRAGAEAEAGAEASGSGKPTPATPRSQTPSPTGQSGKHTDTTAPAAAEGESALPALAVAAGGGLLIAGVLGGLVTRRVMQQRRRRRGRRIPMPTGRASETELDLRATEPLDPGALDQVLRTAAAGLAEQERELPPLDAVVLGSDTAELHLQQETEPVAPFSPMEGDERRWVCSLTSRVLLDAETAADMEAPWPGLVTIGTLPDGRLVLVDLEEIRLLHLAGPQRHALARSLASELTVSQLADHLQLVLPETVAPGLAATSDRLESYDSCSEVIEPLRRHHAAQVAALQELRMDRVRQARAADVGSGGWIPHVLLVDEASAQPEDLAVVREVVTARPGSSTAVVISTRDTGHSSSDEEEGWVLRADGDELVQLPGSRLQVRLTLFDDASYEDLVELLAEAQRETDVPAPTPGVEEAALLPRAPLASCPESLEETDDPAPGPSLVKHIEDDVPLPAARGSLLGRLADDDLDDGFEEVEGFGTGALPSQGPKTEHGQEKDAPAAPRADDPAALSSLLPGTGRPEDVPLAPPPAVPPQEPHPLNSPSPEAKEELPRPGDEEKTEGPAAPLVRLLGPVELVGTRGTQLSSNRRSTATELVAWLVLHPGRDRQTIEEAIWRGREVKRKTVTEMISRTRAWMGATDTGDPYFPVAGHGGRYKLHHAVSSDWHHFQQLVAHGESTSGPEGALALRRALELVQGRPFSGIPPTRYSWAESLMQEMISAITDTAEILAERYLVAGQPRDALWAVARGLEAGPEMEQLHRQRFSALRALGDIEGLRRAAQSLERENAERGLETEEETHEILRVLLADAEA